MHRPNVLILIALTAFSTLSLNMFLPSLANIAVDLDAPYATVSLAVSGYLAFTAVIQLIIGPVSDRVGRRSVLLVALAIFALASVACAIATHVWVFLACRMLQGGMIAGYALSLAMVRDTTPERQAASVIGYISMAMAIAPMLGPIAGGLLDAAFGWRANFYAYAIAGGGLFVLCWVHLPETRPVDLSDDRDIRAGLASLLRDLRFWAFSLCGAFSTGAFYIFLTGAPLVAQIQFGVETAELGLYIGSITAGFMVGGFLSGRFAAQFAPITVMLAGRLIACAGLVAGILSVTLGHASPVLVFGSTIFVGLGNGVTMPSCNVAAMSIQPRLAGSAAGVNGALVVAGGALLTTVTGMTLPSQDPALALLLLMLFASAASLLAVLLAAHLSRKRS